MDVITLNVGLKDPGAKAKDLRGRGMIPAEFYGRGIPNKSFQIEYQAFRKVFKAAGENTVIQINVAGKEKLNALVHDVQYDPVSDVITHIDFINVRMDEKIHTKIPVKLFGTCAGVKDLGGILMNPVSEIEVKCLPKDLIHVIEVNVEPLVDFHSYIRVKDLKLPEVIAVLNSSEDIIATVVPPKKEEEVPVVAAPVEGEAAAAGEPATGEGAVAGEGAPAAEVPSGKKEKA